jgi:hypothetical protein
MLAGRPKELASNPELLSESEAIIPSARLEAFTLSSGMRLRELSEGCIAGFDYGTLYLARVGTEVRAVRKSFEARLVTDPVVRSSRPDLWRMTGLVANTPESLLTVDDDFVAISVGDPLLVRIVEGFATDRFRKSKPVLKGAAFAALPASFHGAPLRFYAPGPFTGPWAQAADGVLARTFAVGIGLTLQSTSALHVSVVLTGAFGPDVQETQDRLRRAWQNLQASPVGHVLRLDQTLEPAVVSVQPEIATLEVSFATKSLVQGISAAVIQDVAQLMQMGRDSPPAAN